MLDEYARYIENIRNGLVQCGVVFPQISDIVGLNYWDLFHTCEKLTDILYFYKIMVCSGNIEGMFLPMDKSYRGTVRLEAFTEFKEDILPSLKEQFGDEDEDSFNIESICDIEGAEEDEDEPEVWVNEDIGVEDTLIEASDLFDDDSVDDSTLDEQFVASGASLWGASDTDWVAQGTNLFSKVVSDTKKDKNNGTNSNSKINDEPKPEKATEPVEYVEKGTELFSIRVEETSQQLADEEEIIWESEDDPVSSKEDIWEDDPQDVWVEDSESEVDPDDVWVEDSEDMFDSEENQDDVWVSEEEDQDDVWDSEEDPDDVWVSEDDDSEDIENFDNKSVNNVIDWEDDSKDELFSWEDGSEEPETPEPTKKKEYTKPSTKSKNIVEPVRDPDYEADIVDTVQEAASAALTSAKRFLINLTNPKK